jgi:ABC-type multidrug transport system fused ATPase/permease subunit
MNIPTGSSIGIVDASESGKSSIKALIERFYDLVVRVVYINEQNIRSMLANSL